MSQVGVFPGWRALNRRTQRAPVNPMDKATVVSIFPKKIQEVKPTITPGVFELEAGSYEKPALLVVGPSSWWKEVSEEEPLLEIPCHSVQVAESIVRDYCNGLLVCNMGDTMPGMFHLPGEWTHAELLKKHKHTLDTAAANQKRWYEALVKMADGLWAKSNGNPLVVSDDMRMAARQLALNNKDWMTNQEAFEMIRCAACGSLRNPAFPVCSVCRYIDPAHPMAKELTFAKFEGGGPVGVSAKQ